MRTKFTVLVEDSLDEAKGGLRAEKGLSLLIETQDEKILFDTGVTGEALSHNADRLGADLSSLSTVVISHAHYDHVGGLSFVKDRIPPAAPLYVHFDLFCKSWVHRADGTKKRVDGRLDPNRFWRRQNEREEEGQGFVLFSNGPREILPGALLSGPIPTVPDPRTAGMFTIQKDGREIPDPFLHEQFLLLKRDSGWCLVSGCCHHGVKNTLAFAQRLTGGEEIHTIIGGLHTRDFTTDELEEIWTHLRESGVQRLLIGHCTGPSAIKHASSRSGIEVEPLFVGKSFTL